MIKANRQMPGIGKAPLWFSALYALEARKTRAKASFFALESTESGIMSGMHNTRAIC